MDTNLLGLFMGTSQIAQMPVADLSIQNPQFFPVQDGVENFENLLDLVSDISLADSQSPEFSEAMEESLKGIEDKATSELVLQANESQIALQGIERMYDLQTLQAQPAKTVGQDFSKNPEIVKGYDSASMPFDALERESLSLTGVRQLAKEPLKPTGESVQLWAAGLATGEIESVKVVEGAPKVSPAKLEAQTLSATSENLGQAVHNEIPQAVNFKIPQTETFQQEQPFSELVTESKQSQVETVKKPEMLANARHNEIKAEPKAESLGQERATDKRGETVSKTEKNAESESSNKVWKSEDFILNQQTKTVKKMEPNSQLSDFAPAAAFVTQDAVQQRVQGPVSTDSRLSAHSVGFVAEKVQNLMEQGGGYLKVEMNPKNLGNIEIRVALKQGGGVDVKIVTEKESTRQALAVSQTELSQKIEASVGRANLEISPRIDVARSFEAVKNFQVNEAVVSSQDLGQWVEGKWDGKLDLPKFDTLTSSQAQTSAQSRNQQGFGGDSSRERAMEQWEEQFRQRKSA
jgi:hypothetical protein